MFLLFQTVETVEPILASQRKEPRDRFTGARAVVIFEHLLEWAGSRPGRRGGDPSTPAFIRDRSGRERRRPVQPTGPVHSGRGIAGDCHLPAGCQRLRAPNSQTVQPDTRPSMPTAAGLDAIARHLGHIGVRKRTLEVLAVDPDAFAGVDGDA